MFLFSVENFQTFSNLRTFSAIAEPRLYILDLYKQPLFICNSCSSAILYLPGTVGSPYARNIVRRDVKTDNHSIDQWKITGSNDPCHSIPLLGVNMATVTSPYVCMWNINSQGSSFNIVILTNVLKTEWKMQFRETNRKLASNLYY